MDAISLVGMAFLMAAVMVTAWSLALAATQGVPPMAPDDAILVALLIAGLSCGVAFIIDCMRRLGAKPARPEEPATVGAETVAVLPAKRKAAGQAAH